MFEEAGLPPGVINFITGNSAEITRQVFTNPAFAGVHFTGSTPVFKSMWTAVGENINNYNGYPRLVGETGGKDFIIAHPSADPQAVSTAIIRGAFEYQGQKCSAASRIYLPETIWAQIKDGLIEEVDNIAMGDVCDFRNFMGAVIDKSAFDKITGYIDRAHESEDSEIVAGGTYDGSKGYFIRPTIVLAKKPDVECMCDEIFGPVVTVYVYPDAEWSETLKLVDQTGDYALTGAVFSQGPSSRSRGEQGSPVRRRELLHQRQTHRRGGGPAALRRGPGQRNQRQGGIEDEPPEVGVGPDHEGDLRLPHFLWISLHGRGVAT